MGSKEKKSFHICLFGPSSTPAKSTLGGSEKEHKEWCVSALLLPPVVGPGEVMRWRRGEECSLRTHGEQ